ncbi:MAG: hypothetical protein M1819_002638 [Sarea resinae]|nr:MAG: hypothetical protein M1819_002638 [Sarea resinae]
MRTSRLSRDTSKLIGAAASPASSRVAAGAATSRQTRAFAKSLRAFATATPTLADSEEPGQLDSTPSPDSSSELSSVPSSPSRDDDVAYADGDEDESANRPSKRRKRDNDVSTTTPSMPASKQAHVRSDVNTSSRPKRKPRKLATKKTEDGLVAIHAPPPHWEEVYDTVKAMRARIVAPVDTMGCERLADETASPRDQRFQTLISLMLSSQTKDTVTAATIRHLQTSLPGSPPGLTLENILAVPAATLNDLIHAVGFHNNKTRYIKATAELLQQQHGSDIPHTPEALMALPGVGPKMAYLCLSAAWGRTEGIGVDVHVHRITNLWGWHRTRTPELTRAALESWLPRERWHEINSLLVGLGQTVCLPVGRRCAECDLMPKRLCPGAVVAKSVRSKAATARASAVVKEEEEEEKGEEGVTGTVVEVKTQEAKVEDIEDLLASNNNTTNSNANNISFSNTNSDTPRTLRPKR